MDMEEAKAKFGVRQIKSSFNANVAKATTDEEVTTVVNKTLTDIDAFDQALKTRLTAIIAEGKEEPQLQDRIADAEARA